MEPEDNLENNQAYYFANDAPAMNWYDADQYCAGKGGFLAEPLTTQENDFLKGYSFQFSNTNWWIGKVVIFKNIFEML